MWNLLKYIPGVMENVRKRGFQMECPVSVYRAELKRSTGVLTDRTVSKWMHYLEELGYIKSISQSTIKMCLDFKHPYVFENES